jgi:hypothetical protein
MESHFVKLEPPYQIIHYGGVGNMRNWHLSHISTHSCGGEKCNRLHLYAMFS